MKAIGIARTYSGDDRVKEIFFDDDGELSHIMSIEGRVVDTDNVNNYPDLESVKNDVSNRSYILMKEADLTIEDIFSSIGVKISEFGGGQ